MYRMYGNATNGVYFHPNPSALKGHFQKLFLKLILDMIFGQKINVNNTMNWYRPVFVVISSFQMLSRVPARIWPWAAYRW